MTWRGEQIVDLPPRTAAHDGPGLPSVPIERPLDQGVLNEHDGHNLPRPRGGAELGQPLMQHGRLAQPVRRSWVTDQYDRFVLGNTVLAQPEDAGVVRLDESTAARHRARRRRQQPVHPARSRTRARKLALAEAYRNVAVTGARPLAVTDCLNFGSPEDPAVMWQFAEAVRGLADGCQQLGTPVTGGNVSFYNQTGHDRDPADAGHRRARRDRRRRAAGAAAGSPTTVRRSSCSARPATSSAGRRGPTSIHGFLGGRPPAVDLAREKAAGRRARRRRARGTAQLGARPLRRRPRPGAGRGVPARRRRRAHRPARPTSTRSSRCSANRRTVRWCPSRVPRRRRVHRHCATSTAQPLPAHRHGRRPRAEHRRRTASSRSRCASCAPHGGRHCASASNEPASPRCRGRRIRQAVGRCG